MNKVFITKYLSRFDNNDLPIYGAIVLKSKLTSSKDMVLQFSNTKEFNVSELEGRDVLELDNKISTLPVADNHFIRVKKDGDNVTHLVLEGIKYTPVLKGEFHLFGSVICDLADLKYQSGITILKKDDGTEYTGTLSDLPSGVTYVNVSSCQGITGTLSDLPTGLTYLSTNNNSLVTGNIKDLPTGLTHLDIGNNSLVTGNIKDLPTGLTYLNISNNSLVTGTLESYVEKVYNAHKNDSEDFTLSAHTEATGVTFNGTSTNYLSATTISGGKATVRRGSAQGNIIGTYDGTSWTYNS